MCLLDALFDIYRNTGDSNYIGEPISQVEHAQQAAWLAERAGSRPGLILAAFFHDIGHLCAPKSASQMDGLGVLDHERIGADRLRASGLGGELADLVELHVQAKRYLCCRTESYFEQLSEASRGTLNFQGGPMSGSEAEQFESHPLFRDVLRLRTWDEKAKRVDGEGLSLETLREMAECYQREPI
jgi:phosphonate degradation associated HDIG domain protein